MPDIVRIEHANVRREGKLILKDVSLSLSKGEHIAIVGPNGAGKSTLIDVISRHIYPLATDEYKSFLFGTEKWMRSELEKLRLGLMYSRHLYQKFVSAGAGRDVRVIVVGGRAVAHMVRENKKERGMKE